MTHFLGPLVADGRTVNQSAGLDFVPRAGSLGGPRFVILHFDNVHLNGASKLTVDLGYGVDEFTINSGQSFWTRPANTRQPDGTTIRPIAIRITGGSGSAQLLEFGAGEPSITPGNPPGTSIGSQSNCDPFLHTNPYQEPIFETRLECNPGFAWQQAACVLPSIPTAVKDRVAAATGIIIEVHEGAVSSCTGTLIGADLFLTARHCLIDPSGEDVRSASVTFDYATNCDRTRPSGHAAHFFKVLDEVASGSPPTGSNPPLGNDWVVLRLDAAPGSLPTPLPIRDTALMVGETIFTMHHPNGAAKKAQAGVHDGGTISGFDYAGGSSGSALFDINGQLVGGPLHAGGGCSVDYAPIAPVKAALTNPPAPPTPKDVMIVFDRSGSMTSAAPPIGRAKLQEAKDAAALFVQLVREGQGDRLGLVTFSSTASLDQAAGLAATVKPLLVGPPPFTTGRIGGISAGGSTSIGAGIQTALTGLGASSGNARAVLLLTDGLQNTLPMIESIEPALGPTQLCVIGFGSDADIDGPLLSRIARQHGGDFTRAVDGLALRKFFGHCFGNIFEAGTLHDPEFILRAQDQESTPHTFQVCGEERVTVILGWDDPSTPLQFQIRSPRGKLVNFKRIEEKRGMTWVFARLALPYQGERDGTWTVVVDRVPSGGEFPPVPTDVRYFLQVLAAGGPKLSYLGGSHRVYTGETIHPLVGLHYTNGKAPHAEVELYIDAPSVALGQLVLQAGLHIPSPSADTLGAFHATLQAIARSAGGSLPVAPTHHHVSLFDDGIHDDGALEPDGVYNHPLNDLTKVEGTYHFRAVATYGDTCKATREVMWSIHVEPAIDPDRTIITLLDISTQSGRSSGTLAITPRDPYDNPLGPGRGELFSITPLPGIRIDGKLKDTGDGTYTVPITWNPNVTQTPGVVIQQPDRQPIILAPPAVPIPPVEHGDCTEEAEKLLHCLGLHDPDVKRVRVKKVSIDIDLQDTGCEPPPDC